MAGPEQDELPRKRQVLEKPRLLLRGLWGTGTEMALAVLAYNILGRQIARVEAELEGFARDLRDRFATPVA